MKGTKCIRTSLYIGGPACHCPPANAWKGASKEAWRNCKQSLDNGQWAAPARFTNDHDCRVVARRTSVICCAPDGSAGHQVLYTVNVWVAGPSLSCPSRNLLLLIIWPLATFALRVRLGTPGRLAHTILCCRCCAAPGEHRLDWNAAAVRLVQCQAPVVVTLTPRPLLELVVAVARGSRTGAWCNSESATASSQVLPPPTQRREGNKPSKFFLSPHHLFAMN